MAKPNRPCEYSYFCRTIASTAFDTSEFHFLRSLRGGEPVLSHCLSDVRPQLHKQCFYRRINGILHSLR